MDLSLVVERHHRLIGGTQPIRHNVASFMQKLTVLPNVSAQSRSSKLSL